MSETWVSIQSVDETLAITNVKNDPLRILRTSTLYIAYIARQSGPAKKIQDVASIGASLTLRALLLLWLLLRSCGVLRNCSRLFAF